MMRELNGQRKMMWQLHEEVSQKERDWDEDDGEERELMPETWWIMLKGTTILLTKFHENYPIIFFSYPANMQTVVKTISYF